MVSRIVKRIRGLISFSKQPEDGTSAVEKFITNRVNDSARLGSAAFNASLITSTRGTSLQEGVFESIGSDVMAEQVKGFPNLVEINESFLKSENAPKLASLGIKDAARSVLITEKGVDDIAKEIKWGTDMGATIGSSGVAAFESMAERAAHHVVPLERAAQKIGVMGRKTLSMLIHAGETAAKVMR
ncbi:MAG: hypothetical protein RLZZ196_2769 [Bacteroidota bacterium]|jgi:hypothetical protein